MSDTHLDAEPTPPPRRGWRRHLRWAIPAVFYTAVVVFLALYASTLDFAALAEARIDWWIFAAALAVGILNRYWMVLIWLVLLRGLGAATRGTWAAMSLVYAKSWLGRYIPGTAPWILGKIHFASRLGVSRTKLAVSSLLEAGLQILVLLVTGLALIVFDPRAASITGDLRWFMIAVTIAGLIVLLPPVFNRLFGLAFRIVRRQPVDPQSLPTFGTIGTGAGLYVVGAMLAGISMFLVARSLDPSLGWAELTYLIAAMNLASAVSMLAIFAPSGIGVREAILVLLLGVVMSPELALLTAIVLRIWSIVADFAFLGIAVAVDRLDRRRRRDL